MEIVAELYVCEQCLHVELELNGACPECGSVMKCVEFVPREIRPTTGAVDGLWDCANCDNRKIGSGFAECPNCGTARH